MAARGYGLFIVTISISPLFSLHSHDKIFFSKRRQGLFRKASELCVLSGAEIAMLIQSPADKIFAFSNPSLGSILDRFQTGEVSRVQSVVGEDKRSEYEEAVRKLEREKEKEKRIKEREFWWADEEVESMELHELEEYLGALERLRDNVFQRLEELEKLKSDTSSNLFALPVEFDHAFDGEHCPLGRLEDIQKDSSSSGGCSWDQIDQNFEAFEDLEDVGVIGSDQAAE